MNGAIPDTDKVVGITIAGLCLAVVLIVLGLSEGNEVKYGYRVANERVTPQTVYVVQAKLLHIRDSAPRYVGERRQFGRKLGALPQGTKVRRESDLATGNGMDVWYEVEVLSGPFSRLHGWVSAKYLQLQEE